MKLSPTFKNSFEACFRIADGLVNIVQADVNISEGSLARSVKTDSPTRGLALLGASL